MAFGHWDGALCWDYQPWIRLKINWEYRRLESLCSLRLGKNVLLLIQMNPTLLGSKPSETKVIKQQDFYKGEAFPVWRAAVCTFILISVAPLQQEKLSVHGFKATICWTFIAYKNLPQINLYSNLKFSLIIIISNKGIKNYKRTKLR